MALGCAGNCDGDDAVTVDEIILLLNITHDRRDITACRSADSDGNGDTSAGAIIAAVNRALRGC